MATRSAKTAAAVAASPLNTKVLPSVNWSRAMPAGPDAHVKITESYARIVARDAYFWTWPMVNIYNRRLAFSQCPEPGLINCVLPFAPLNTLSMLHDYIQPEQRWVACPNQDVAWLVDTSAGREEEITFRVGSCGFVDRVFVSREVFEFT